MPNKTELNMDFSELEKLTEKLAKVNDRSVREMMHSAEEDVLDAYVDEIKAITPVRSGELKAGWKKSREKLKGRKNKRYVSAVTNFVPYAHAVEYGRFSRKTKTFDGHGRYMTKATDQKIRRQIDGIVSKSVKKFEDKLK